MATINNTHKQSANPTGFQTSYWLTDASSSLFASLKANKETTVVLIAGLSIAYGLTQLQQTDSVLTNKN